MNKFVFIGIIVLVLGTAGVLVVSGDSKDGGSVASVNTPATSEQKQIDAILSQYTGTGGTYSHLEESEVTVTLANASPEDKNVIFFEGLTCPVCKELDKDISSSNVPDNVRIINLIFEDSPELAKKYNVRATPTLVEVDRDGQVIKPLQPVIKLENILLQLI